MTGTKSCTILPGGWWTVSPSGKNRLRRKPESSERSWKFLRLFRLRIEGRLYWSFTAHPRRTTDRRRGGSRLRMSGQPSPTAQVGHSQRAIAAELGRPPSTISREIRRNLHTTRPGTIGLTTRRRRLG